MCLAIPGQVERVFDSDGLKMATVSFAGVKRAVCIEYAPDAAVGDFVLVHVGFAIAIIDEEEARRGYELLKLTGELDDLAEVETSADGFKGRAR